MTIGILCFIAGLALGSIGQGYRWAWNATAIQRIEWMGKLYKVVLDKDDQP